MSDEKSGPHDKHEGERQEAHDEASALVSNSGHVEVCSHTAQEARDPERPSPSAQLPIHEKAHNSEKSSPGPQPPPRDEAQGSAEKPSLGPQPPTREQEQHASVKVKGPPVAKRNARSVRADQQREEKERMKEERRRLENERRLEGQRLEYERKIEARRKAEEAAAVARAQSEGDERSTNEGKLPQRHSGGRKKAPRVRRRGQQKQSLMEESVKAECREDAEGGSPTVAIKMDDDQKVHNNNDAGTGPRILEHDTGATCLAITDAEHSELHLIMMAHRASTMSLAPPSPPITPRGPSDSASSHSSLGYCYYGKDDVTTQCGLVCEDLREDSQTGMESNYLFDPPLLRLPSPEPVEVQTRQDATDVLFQPSLERSEGSAGAAVVVTVIIPRVKTEYYIRNNGVSTTRNTTHDFEAVTGISLCGEEAVEVLGMECPDKSN